jgi:hypothetical protein
MVREATKTLLAKVSGNSTTVPVLITACGVRATRPRVAQDRPSANRRASEDGVKAGRMTIAEASHAVHHSFLRLFGLRDDPGRR